MNATPHDAPLTVTIDVSKLLKPDNIDTVEVEPGMLRDPDEPQTEPLQLTYRQLQHLVKTEQVGRTDKPTKLNAKFSVLAERYTQLTGTRVVSLTALKHEAAKAVVDAKPYTYRELQQLLKGFGEQCKVRRNSKYEVLLAEYLRLNTTENC